MECSARRVNGSAHCRSSTTRATGTVEANSSKTSKTASTINHPSSASPAPPPTRPGSAVGGHQAGERGARGIGRAPLKLHCLAQGPQRAILLDLVARPVQDPETPTPGERQRLGDQAGLADPRLALKQRDPAPSPGGILHDGAQDVQLDRPTDQPDPRTNADHSHPATSMDTPTGRQQPRIRSRPDRRSDPQDNKVRATATSTSPSSRIASKEPTRSRPWLPARTR